MAKVRRKVKVTMVEKRGVCQPHEVGAVFEYPVVFSSLVRPLGMCPALAHTLEPFVRACYLGAKSWERDNPDIWLISCPSKKGTVWKIEPVELSDEEFKRQVKEAYEQVYQGKI